METGVTKNAHAAFKNMIIYRKLDCEVVYKIDMNKLTVQEGSTNMLIANPSGTL